MQLGKNKFSIKKNDWKKNNKINAINIFYAKDKNYIMLIFQNILQIVKNYLFF